MVQIRSEMADLAVRAAGKCWSGRSTPPCTANGQDFIGEVSTRS